MKKQILPFIIGVLVGAIITTGVFMIIKGTSNNSNKGPNNGQFKEFNGERPEMPDGEMPELPDGVNFDENFKNKKPKRDQNGEQTKTQEQTTDNSSNT